MWYIGRLNFFQLRFFSSLFLLLPFLLVFYFLTPTGKIHYLSFYSFSFNALLVSDFAYVPLKTFLVGMFFYVVF